MAGRRGEAPEVDPVPEDETPSEPDEAQPPAGVVLDDDGPLFPEEATDTEQEALLTAAAALAAKEAADFGDGPSTDVVDGPSTSSPEPGASEHDVELAASELTRTEEAVLATGDPWTPFVGAHVVYVLDRDAADRIGGGMGMGQCVLAIISGIDQDHEGGGLSVWLFPDAGQLTLVRGVDLIPEPSEAGPIHAGKAFRMRQLTL